MLRKEIQNVSMYEEHINEHEVQERDGGETVHNCPWCQPRIFDTLEPQELQDLGKIDGVQMHKDDWGSCLNRQSKLTVI